SDQLHLTGHRGRLRSQTSAVVQNSKQDRKNDLKQRDRMTLRIALLSVAVSLAWPATAQEEPTVRGRFLSDSIRIGEEAIYVLGATYPQNVDVLFPDSTVNTFPFEYARREYFPTVTRNGVSRDSVVYYYRTFEP